MPKLTKEQYYSEDLKLKDLYLSGISAWEISKRSQELFNRSLGISRITTRLKRIGVCVQNKAWNKGLTLQTDTTGRTARRLESFNKSKSTHQKTRPPTSTETKQKISKSRIEYLKNNPNKVGYKLNHSSKESYPEKYFSEIFKVNEVALTRYYRIGLYTLDFCDLESKIDIEVDGGTHKLLEVIEKDNRRDNQLKALGWRIIRIDWNRYQKFKPLEKEEFIKNLIKTIRT